MYRHNLIHSHISFQTIKPTLHQNSPIFERVCLLQTLVHTMEEQICVQNTASSSLAIHKNSKTKSKVKSKIRIIHIFAPEIIKTDAANFRELVQRLTGKPTDEQKDCSKRKSRIFSSNKKMEQLAMRAGFHAVPEQGFRERVNGEEEFRERIKEEEEIWRDANTGGDFLGGFSEFDQFPFMEGTTQIDVYEEPQLT